MSQPTPFKIEIPQTTVNKIMERVRAFEWPDAYKRARNRPAWTMRDKRRRHGAQETLSLHPSIYPHTWRGKLLRPQETP